MEEKERFELLNDNFIYDKKLKEYVVSPSVSLKCYIGTLADLLNQQDKEIKYLQKLNTEIIMQNKNILKDAEIINQENQQLKQSQKQLAIEQLERVKEINFNHFIFYDLSPKQALSKWIDNQIKNLKEGK